MIKRVVIIGGSYAGLKALEKLAPHIGIEITLIDRHPYHFLQTEGYDLIAGRTPFDNAIIGLRSLCAGYGKHVTFLHAVVHSVDLDQKSVILEEGKDLSYDYLIIAAGAVTRFVETVEGLRNYASGVKSLRSVLKVKGYFEEELYKRLESAHHAQEHYAILIGGAGLSGVEIAAEMQAFFNRYYRSNSLSCGTLTIHLVSGSKEILSGMHPRVIRQATQRLRKLGVRLHLGERIARVEESQALLEGGREVPFDFMIFTGGIMAAPFLSTLQSPRNPLGQLIVRSTLQLPEYDEVFVAGDAAELRDKQGKPIPSTAQSAEQSGTYAGKNLLRLLQEKPPQPVQIKLRGYAIALGGYYALVDTGRFQVEGFPAWIGKKLMEKLYKLPLRRRARHGFTQISRCEDLAVK